MRCAYPKGCVELHRCTDDGHLLPHHAKRAPPTSEPFAYERPSKRMTQRPVLAMLVFVAIVVAAMWLILPAYNIKVPLP